MEKLIIRIPKSERTGKEPVIRLNDEAMKALKEVSIKSGLLATSIKNKYFKGCDWLICMIAEKILGNT